MFGIITGAIRGAQTLVRGSAVADPWGIRNYGTINGVFAAPITAITALGPALRPVLAVTFSGYSTMVLVIAGLALMALGAEADRQMPGAGSPCRTRQHDLPDAWVTTRLGLCGRGFSSTSGLRRVRPDSVEALSDFPGGV
ncbi:hypothetical protein [Agromyces sp. NPDC058110]|uniref:hypothetical protein n=1 Tax=Agromyces sp. NPDC058110 TaxID=3346345 RepID=UPI0036DF9483